MDLTVSGKNILDEGFNGANVRDKENNNKFSKSGADFLLENIKKATTPVKNTGMRNKDAISFSISTIAKSLGNNTEAVQKIVDENNESQEEFVKLVKMMAAAQEKTGEASVAAINQLLQQIAKIEIKSGDKSEELIKLLGLDKTKETLSKQSDPLGFAGTAFKKFTNVDVRENETFGESLKQAFSKEKLFGIKPKIDFESIEQQKGQAESLGSVTEATIADTKKPETIKRSTKDATVSNVETNAEGGKVFSAGIDRESSDNKQVELLEAILAELKNMGQIGEGDDEGGFPGRLPGRLPGRGPKPSTVKPEIKPKTSMLSRVGGLAKGAGRVLGKVALPLAAGMAIYDGVKGFSADENATTGQKFKNAGRNIMSGLTFGLVDSTQEKMEDGSYQADREAQAQYKNDLDAAVKAKQQGSQETTFTASYSSDNPMQMGPGDVKEYNTRLEEINNMEGDRRDKADARQELDMEFRAKFAGTPKELAAKEAYKKHMQEEKSGATTSEAVEGTATTTPPRNKSANFDEFFDGGYNGTPIVDPGPVKKQQRAEELAEQMNLDTAKDIEYVGHVPSMINGVAVPPELLTEDERKQQQTAKDLGAARQGTPSANATPTATTSEAVEGTAIPNPQNLEGEVLKEYEKLYTESPFNETREEQKDLAREARLIVEDRNQKGNQTTTPVTPSVSVGNDTDSSDNLTGTPPGVYEAGIRTKDADGNSIPLSEEEQSKVDMARSLKARLSNGNSVTPSVSTGRNDNSAAVDTELKELNQKAVDAEIAYNENPSEENYNAMADATQKSDQYILENNVPSANALMNMSPSDPQRMLMTGSDSGNVLERIETSVTPTADAVGNMTEAAVTQGSQQTPTVINNITNNNTQASNSAPPVLINPTTARNSVNSFIDFQSRQYTRA